MKREKKNGDREIGERIRALRTDRGMTICGLARLVHVSDTSIGRLERGESMVSVFTMRRIAGELGVSVSELLEGPAGGKAGARAAANFQACTPREQELIRSVFAQILELIR